jgi:hypothetical protein
MNDRHARLMDSRVRARARGEAEKLCIVVFVRSFVRSIDRALCSTFVLHYSMSLRTDGVIPHDVAAERAEREL